jgi:hypothetical protein
MQRVEVVGILRAVRSWEKSGHARSVRFRLDTVRDSPCLAYGKGRLEMVRKAVCLLALCLFLSGALVAAQEISKGTAAMTATEKWLALVDEERYGESWNEAAPYFKDAVQQEQWVQSLEARRKPFGRAVSREMKKMTYKTSLPGAPDGEYMVIQFATSFGKKRAAVETVTTTVDRDGSWRVSGYFIR